ncbi:MAG TPA: hypothetical protein PLK35_02665 [Candidatus Moranbacteria bacterium]|nr:hypothetical protein [Candidatus Moranbacteria bacterium]
MFSILKSIIWIAGTLVVAYFVLGYFGYEVNLKYLTESREKCEERLRECGKDLVRQGTENVQCDIKCVDRKILIKKR